MRPRGMKPEPGQRWEACSWQAADRPRRTVEVTGVSEDAAGLFRSARQFVTVKTINGTGPAERRILAESLMAKYKLLPAEDSDANQGR